MELIFGVFFFFLFWIYFGYPLFLFLFTKIRKRKREEGESDVDFCPSVSIVIAAYNEQKIIGKRIKNCLDLDYPKDKIEIIIASDGSTDETVKISKRFKDNELPRPLGRGIPSGKFDSAKMLQLRSSGRASRKQSCEVFALGENKVVVLDFKENRGRAITHNEAVKRSNGKIVVFTDAATEFDRKFLMKIVENFKEGKTGCVVGNLIYRLNDGYVSNSEGIYWKFEKKIREMESNLGILTKATGACMAIRKKLWDDLGQTDDCDTATPLKIALKGYKIVFEKRAISYDVPSFFLSQEYRVRSRQTSKNFISILKNWSLNDWIRYPLMGLGLFSHKILRWLTPFFMILIFLSNIFIINENIFYAGFFGCQIIFYFLGLIGLFADFLNIKIPIASTIVSFCVANIGMGAGVIKGILGIAPARYENK